MVGAPITASSYRLNSIVVLLKSPAWSRTRSGSYRPKSLKLAFTDSSLALLKYEAQPCGARALCVSRRRARALTEWTCHMDGCVRMHPRLGPLAPLVVLRVLAVAFHPLPIVEEVDAPVARALERVVEHRAREDGRAAAP